MGTDSLTGTLRETLAQFDPSGEPRTTTEVATDLDLGRRSTYYRLERLVEHDRLKTKKVGANGRVWWRPAAAAPATPDWPAAAESLVDDVLDDVEVGMFVLDENFDVAWINEATGRYFGLESGHAIGRDKRRLIDEHIRSVVEDSEQFAETVLATYDDNTYTEQFECHVTAGDGREERWLEHRSRPIESGAYAGGRVELYYDVTDRKRSQQERREQSQEFTSLVEAVDEYAIFTLDSEGYVQTWNPGAERIKGYTADEIVGEHFSQFYTEEERTAGVPEKNLAAAAQEGSVEDEGWRVRKDGSRFWGNVTITAIRDDDGDIQRYAKVTRDMTDRRRSEAERELLYKTTRSIAEADTFDEGLQAALQDICTVTNWEYAEAWLPTDEGSLTRADADYYVDDIAEFAAFSEEFTFPAGEGLPGQVYTSGTFEWVADLSSGSTGEFPRLNEALDAGLKSSLGVPVVVDDEVVAVLTFLVRETQNIEEQVVDLVSSVATELGALIGRKRAQERLDREREIVKHVFETAPVGISVFESDGEMVRANEQMANIFDSMGADTTGYTAGDVPMRNEDGESLSFEERPVGRVFGTGDPVVNQELQVPGPGESVQWISVNATPVTDADGEIVQVIATATDITQLKEQAERLERRREELESELEDIFARVDDAFYAVDEEMRFEYVNDRAEDLIGRTEPELLGRTIWEALSVADDDPIRERFRNALETQTATSFERYSDPLGIWELVRVYPSESGLSVYFTDITEHKEHERELEEYRRWTRTLIENYPGGAVALVDEDLRYVTFGGTPEGDADVTRADLEGQSVCEALPEQIAEVVVPRYEAALDGEPSEFVDTIDGQVYQFKFVPVRDDDGDVFAATAMSYDITERKERERELEEARSRYQTLVENFPNGAVALVDRDLRYVTVGGTPLDEAGVTMDDLVGSRLEEILPDDLADILVPRYEAALDGEGSTFERTTDDGSHVFHVVPVRDDDGEVFAAMGMSQDVTEQKEYERYLEDAKSQLEAATEAGAIGTWEWHVPEDEMVTGPSFARTFGVSPDEAREGVSLDRFIESIHPDDRERVQQGIQDTLATCGQYESEYRAMNADGEYRWVVARGHVECDDDGEPVTFPGALTDITDRKEAELELERQRKQLAALNNINAVVQDITGAIIEQSTREEIEQIVCERLADSDSYEFAWVCEVDSATGSVVPRVEAGVDGYVENIPLSIDPDVPSGQGPTGEALRTQETQVANAFEDSQFDPWRDYAKEYGYRSSAAIPIVHEGTVYGVLGVYADRPRAFDGQERTVVSQLGEVVGHAIAAAERKQALLSDELVELDVRIQDVFAAVDAPVETSGTITLDQTVPTDNGEFLVYGTATQDALDAVHGLVDVLPHWESVTVISEDDPARFELQLSDPPVLSAVASRGGYLDEAIIEDGEYRMTIHLAPSTDVRQVTEAVEAAYPQAKLLRRQQISQTSAGSRQLQRRLAADLTSSQRSALEAAYHAGFFRWPRDSTGEQVAESLGIAPPTFHQHLRKAQQKAFDALLSDPISEPTA